jgi:anti-sigma regulatory factor (Ser/Thr protein kinase)
VVRPLPFPAVPEHARTARTFVAGALGGSHPDAGVALLLVGELVASSVQHSGSSTPSGLVEVTVEAGGGVRVEVTDSSGDGVPVLPPPASAGGEAEGGRGLRLRLVDRLAARWGYCRGGGRTTTWFELARD